MGFPPGWEKMWWVATLPGSGNQELARSSDRPAASVLGR